MTTVVLTATRFFSTQPTEEEESDFWSSIRLPNRTYKTTNSHRLDDLNKAVLEYWRTVGATPNSILDVGVSSGVTTVEWYEFLCGSNLYPKIVATDISLNAKILQPFPHYRVLVRDTPNMEPLQHAILGWPLPPHFHFGLRSLVGGTVTVLMFNMLKALAVPMRVDNVVQLLSPRVAKKRNISFVEDDIFDRQTKAALGTFGVVRAANILNLNYFTKAELQEAIENIKGLLDGAGSFLILVRTHSDGSNHGTMFRLGDSGRFEPVVSVGNGSEISELVLNV